MPADNVLGWRADTLALLRELDSPVYRWPGGNFVSGYDWQDGIGDRDRRPPRKNPAWKGIESNDVGLHEFMALCREIGAEPYVAVNTGLGGRGRRRPSSSSTRTAPRRRRMGRRRAENGSPAPFGSSSGRSATRCTATGSSATCRSRSTSRSTARWWTRCGPVDPTIAPVAVGARRRVEPDDARDAPRAT